MKHLYGIVRSLVIYYLRPGRTRALVEHYRRFIEPGDLAFDIGAHVGNRTRAFALLGAQTVAFEPQKRPGAFLRRVFRNTPTVTVDGRAVGAEDGTIDLLVCPSNPTIATTSQEWATETRRLPGWNRFSFTETETVPQVRLDSLILEYGLPRFVKIDVEGTEAEVLAGLSQPVAALSFEFLPADRDVALHALLRLERIADDDGGRYEYNFSLGEELRLVMPDRWWSAAELQEYLAEIPGDGPSGDIYARYTKSGGVSPSLDVPGAER